MRALPGKVEGTPSIWLSRFLIGAELSSSARPSWLVVLFSLWVHCLIRLPLMASSTNALTCPWQYLPVMEDRRMYASSPSRMSKESSFVSIWAPAFAAESALSFPS